MRSRSDTISVAPRRQCGRPGYLLSETLVAVAVLGLLLSCMARFHHSTAKYNKRLLLRRQCVAAGQAQLDSLAATGREIDPTQMERLWPGITCAILRSDGEGEWAGLTLVTVDTSGSTNDREVSLCQSRYLAPRKEVRP